MRARRKGGTGGDARRERRPRLPPRRAVGGVCGGGPPLQHVRESLLFLAWGITGVHLVVTERDAGSANPPSRVRSPPRPPSPPSRPPPWPFPPNSSAPPALVPAAQIQLAHDARQRHDALLRHPPCWLSVVHVLPRGGRLAGMDRREGRVGIRGGHGDEGCVRGCDCRAAAAGRGAAAAAWTRRCVSVTVLRLAARAAARARLRWNSRSSRRWRRDDRLLKEMDNLAYRCLGAGFALLTAGLISGAVWAGEAWGSYWSWDPKETWALITWFTYATYLHSRLVAGKSNGDGNHRRRRIRRRVGVLRRRQPLGRRAALLRLVRKQVKTRHLNEAQTSRERFGADRKPTSRAHAQHYSLNCYSPFSTNISLPAGAAATVTPRAPEGDPLSAKLQRASARACTRRRDRRLLWRRRDPPPGGAPTPNPLRGRACPRGNKACPRPPSRARVPTGRCTGVRGRRLGRRTGSCA